MKITNKISSPYLAHKHGIDDEHVHDHISTSNMDHNHDYGAIIRHTSSKVLFWSLLITFTFSIIGGIGGYIINSTALMSDAIHMLTDAAGLLIAYFASIISKKPANINLTFGYGKAEVLGALINCIFTTILTIGLLVEVIQRIIHPVAIHGAALFIIASLGFIANGIVAYLLSRNSHSLNTKAALLHSISDMMASFIAIIAGIIIYLTNFWLIDPLLSLILIVLLTISNYKIIKKSVLILMAGVPEDLDYEQIGKDLEAIPGVKGVHDLHIWFMSANKVSLTAHIIAEDSHNWQATLSACQKMLFTRHNIEHATLQYEMNKNICKTSECDLGINKH